MISVKSMSINQYRVTSNLHKLSTFNNGLSILMYGCESWTVKKAEC